MAKDIKPVGTEPGPEEGKGKNVNTAESGNGKGADPGSESTADKSTANTRSKPNGFDQIRIIGADEGETEINSSVVPGVTKPPKEPKASTPKKPRQRTQRPKNGPAVDKKRSADAIATMLKTTSEIGALRMGGHWALTPEECQKIAEPSAELLERYDLTKLLGEYGDWAALIVALGTAIVPRVMITTMNNKMIQAQKQQLQSIQGGKPNVQSKQQPAPAGVGNASQGNANGGSHNQGPTPDDQTDTKQLLASLMG